MKIVVLVCFSAALSYSHPGSNSMTITETENKIDSVLKASKGTYALAFKDLQNGKTILRNASETFHAASTMKTPVMIEVYRQSRAGKFSLDDSLEVSNSFKSIIDGSPYSLDISSDSDDSLYNRIGKKMTIRKLVFDMITVSSNLATNLLIQKVGPKNVQRTVRALGTKDLLVLRGVEDSKAFEAGRNNITTAGDLALIFDLLARKKAVSRKASGEMLDVLLHQKFNDMIPASLPKNVKVAHKTGSITGVQHDSGIVYLPDGRKYVLVLLSKDLPDAKAGIETIARVSRIIYDYETQ